MRTKIHVLWLSCGFALVLGMLLGVAARAPRVDAADPDVPVYLDALAGWEDWSWDSTVDLDQAAVVKSGARAVAVTHTAAYGAFSVRTATPLSGVTYGAIEFWAYGTSGGSKLALSVQTTDGGAAGPSFNFTAPAGMWTYYKVPLTALGSPVQIARINWQDDRGAAHVQPYYLDEIRVLAAQPVSSFPDAVADGQGTITPGPSGVAIAPNGRVYAAVYQASRVYSWPSAAAMTGGDAPDKTFGSANGDPDNGGCTVAPSATVFCGPESLVVDSAGNLFVADTYHHRVLVFKNPDTDASPLVADAVLGQPVGDLANGTPNYDGNAGDGIVEGFCYVRGLAVDGGDNLWVVDEFNHRVLKFNTPLTADTLPDLVLGRETLGDVANPCKTDASGQNAADRFDLPLGVAVDGDGHVFVAEFNNNRVQRFAPPAANGADAAASYGGLSGPHDVAVDGGDNLYIADTRNNRVLVYAEGAAGDTTADHTFPNRNYPMGMAFTAGGDFLLADCGAPAPNTGYPPCVSGARGVYLFEAPDSTATPTPVTVTPDPGADVVLSVDASADRAAISPYIYGMNHYGASADVVALMQELGLPVRRWGGNATSRYNWQTDISNHASDWYFGNVKQSDAGNLPTDSAVNRLILQNRQAGAESFLVIPMSGYVANSSPSACGFSVAKYGAQKETAATDGRPDCGNGIKLDGSFVAGNDPLDTSTAASPAFVKDWIAYLTGRFGTAANGGIRFYNLDNEPDLWFETHRDVRPVGLKYADLRDLSYQYGAAIKQADPTAQLLGPAFMGWTYYWHSPYDGQRKDWETPDDRNANGGTPLVPWYLQQMAAYEQANGVRILDYLDLHYYPQGGVALTGAGDAATQAKRLRSTRSLWDPTYVDESWIKDAGPDEGKVRLIPRMREWVAQNYPGTKLAIGEYNWGALDHINGALAQADVLGIFGREGLDLATLWQPPAPDDPGAFAFRIYRNYDGAGSRFGDTKVRAASSDQGKLAVYAAQRGDKTLTVIVINKTGEALQGQVQLQGFTAAGPAQVYQYSGADLAAIVQAPEQPVPPGGFTAAFPASSITLFEIPSTANPTPTEEPTPEPTEEPTEEPTPGQTPSPTGDRRVLLPYLTQ